MIDVKNDDVRIMTLYCSFYLFYF